VGNHADTSSGTQLLRCSTPVLLNLRLCCAATMAATESAAGPADAVLPCLHEEGCSWSAVDRPSWLEASWSVPRYMVYISDGGLHLSDGVGLILVGTGAGVGLGLVLGG
jgi:hypothetical protein